MKLNKEIFFIRREKLNPYAFSLACFKICFAFDFEYFQNLPVPFTEIIGCVTDFECCRIACWWAEMKNLYNDVISKIPITRMMMMVNKTAKIIIIMKTMCVKARGGTQVFRLKSCSSLPLLYTKNVYIF